MLNRKVYTAKTKPMFEGKVAKLKDFLEPENKIASEYYIDDKSLKTWMYLKGGKKEERVTKSGFKYFYNEGPIAFPDYLDKPSRTIVTGEGGPSPSRFKHVVKVNGKYRRLTPVELEKLNMFEPNHTFGVSDIRRAFFMGNALVVGIVTKLGEELIKRI